jgi:hypothetical protein
MKTSLRHVATPQRDYGLVQTIGPKGLPRVTTHAVDF